MNAKHLSRLALAAGFVGLLMPAAAGAQSSAPTGAADAEVTFASDIAPILQRSCQNCHRPASVAPMPLLTYEQVRPWARAMKMRTGLRSERGAMPPWFIERDLGIQHYKNDISLSEEEIEKIAVWADNGAPLGDPADLPPPLEFRAANEWEIGEPDLIVESPSVVVPAAAPDKWTSLGTIPIDLEEDRYVAAVEVKEFNDIPPDGTGDTVGGRYVFHHMTYGAVAPGRLRPVVVDALPGARGRPQRGHLPGQRRAAAARRVVARSRDGPTFTRTAARRARTSSSGSSCTRRATSRRSRTRARCSGTASTSTSSPTSPTRSCTPTGCWTRTPGSSRSSPHQHAPGMRMCLEAIWGHNIETLACVGYDHNWVKQYIFDDDYAPLLPKGTILHIIGWLDTTAANRNVADPRNWSGGGRRSVANMFIDLGEALELSDEQFEREMAERRDRLGLTPNDHVIGCPLCLVEFPSQMDTIANEGGQ